MKPFMLLTVLLLVLVGLALSANNPHAELPAPAVGHPAQPLLDTTSFSYDLPTHLDTASALPTTPPRPTVTVTTTAPTAIYTPTPSTITRTVLLSSRSARPTITRTVTVSNSTHRPSTSRTSSREVTTWVTLEITSTTTEGVEPFTATTDEVVTVTGDGGLWKAGGYRLRPGGEGDRWDNPVAVGVGLALVLATVRILF